MWLLQKIWTISFAIKIWLLSYWHQNGFMFSLLKGFSGFLTLPSRSETVPYMKGEKIELVLPPWQLWKSKVVLPSALDTSLHGHNKRASIAAEYSRLREFMDLLWYFLVFKSSHGFSCPGTVANDFLLSWQTAVFLTVCPIPQHLQTGKNCHGSVLLMQSLQAWSFSFNLFIRTKLYVEKSPSQL